MLNSKPIENPDQYVSHENLINTLGKGKKISEIFYPDVVNDIKASTNIIRRVEEFLLLMIMSSFLYLFINFQDVLQSERILMVSFTFITFSSVTYLILRNIRTEITFEKLLEKSNDKIIAAAIIDYFKLWRKSKFDVAKETAAELISLGKRHKADGGIMLMLGNPDDRYAIRKFTMGWGELYFPKAELIIPPSMPIVYTVQNEKNTGKIHIEQNLNQISILNSTTIYAPTVNTNRTPYKDVQKRSDNDLSKFTQLAENHVSLGMTSPA